MVQLNPFRKMPEQGADNPVWVATDPGLFVDREDVVTPGHTLSPERCEALWERTAELVGMAP